MPYLSKIPLNPRRNGALRFLGNPHAIHAAVLASLATQPVTERLLWRLETGNPHRPELLVLTHSRPDFTHLIEQAGWPNADGGQPLTRDYTPLLDRVAVGREFAFRLTASPVQSLRRPQKMSPEQTALRAQQDTKEGTAAQRGVRGFRVPHRTAAHQLAWLLTHTDRAGFKIPLVTQTPSAPGLGDQGEPAPDVALTARSTLRFSKKNGGREVVVSTATFQGRLHVTDADALRTALTTGIGPSKAYGQGLLTLAPAAAPPRHG
ncbi:type I-E CRISPR-associated protein Cas6/Cse3/CasE [Streptomyces sp. NBC_00237]|uniref:type I-E CRISPR-associated protein Cas6/Cse3/CasE n=1 Tax=Streptomyces sp. NBC_00237 TaxID=2975687 RepID=UPI002256A025|nr:type I-E CRISPR-associated protein Cas6/Cse3/CasE [Streptomyces sp. NBC_00237]MCX5206049.1 type I-E CRISPR-associated protein Cas6/Cse3/CasE [Streptomyces sp. NBC_00237]